MTVKFKLSDRHVGYELIQTCSGRELHAALGVGRDYSTWVKSQIKRGRFVENRDFVLFTQKGEQLASGAKWMTEYHFTIDAGKHIGMMSNTERGFEVREYFIACERAAKGLPAAPQIQYSVGARDTLTKAEQDELRAILTEGAQVLPPTQRGAFLMKGWSKLKAHFKAPYREIPRSEFSEALSIVTRHVTSFESPHLPAPAGSDAALHQALDTMKLMAGSFADLASAMANLTHPPPRRRQATKGEAGMRLDPHPASVTRNPSSKVTDHVGD